MTILDKHIHYSAAGGAGTGGPAGDPGGGGGDGQRFNAAAENARLAAEIAGLRRDQAQYRQGELLRGAFDAIPWASGTHADHARRVFSSEHSVEVDAHGRAMAIGANGQRQPLGEALEAWSRGPGGHYRAAAAQPGAGTLPGFVPNMQQPSIADMPREDFEKLLEKGVSGPLVPGGQVLHFQRAANPYAKGRDAWLSKAWGQGQINKGRP